MQDYIEGEEFVVDSVSSNAEHKIVALWKYDKRLSQDGESFLYYSTELLREANGPIVDALISYSNNVKKKQSYYIKNF